MTAYAKIRMTVLAAGLAALGAPGIALGQVAVSDLPEILVAETHRLPEGPLAAGGAEDCAGNFDAPKTAAGKFVQKHGWGVVSEAALGRYQLVSFAGAFIAGTSGSCAIAQSNIGVFEGTELKAILYTANKADQLIGSLDALEDGTVRIWNGDFLSQPVGDIRAGRAGLVVGKIAAEDGFCGGAVSVPTLYGAPITEARTALQDAGWKPVPQPREEFGQQGDLQDIGITEAQSCSGTGFGFCSYIYDAKGATLDLTTVGELYEDDVPSVAGYAVTCAD